VQSCSPPLFAVAARVWDDLACCVAGAHDFLAKPFGVAELAVRARSALRVRADRRRLQGRERRLVN
jgi:DNA-binding response OmpR family regulator